jgi:Caspase domain
MIPMRRLPTIFIALCAAAQTREKRIVPIDPNQRQTFEKQRKVGVAILVGVGKYPRYSGLTELRYPGRDVDLLAKELESQRYVVTALKDGEATRGSVLNAIQQAGEVVDQKNGTIAFFFSGHGFADQNTNYLATFDATANNLSQTGLSINAVEKALTGSGAPRRVMWVDACRNETNGAKGTTEARSFAKFNASTGSRILFSTKAGKISYEDDELQQGLFSYFLVRGLRGEAARSDGLVSFRDLADFVEDGVQTRSLKQGRVQVPYEAGESNGDFLLAHARSGSTAPVQVDPPPPQQTRKPMPPTEFNTRFGDISFISLEAPTAGLLQATISEVASGKAVNNQQIDASYMWPKNVAQLCDAARQRTQAAFQAPGEAPASLSCQAFFDKYSISVRNGRLIVGDLNVLVGCGTSAVWGRAAKCNFTVQR